MNDIGMHDAKTFRFTVHATTSDERRAAQIAQRLIDAEGVDAVIWDVHDLIEQCGYDPVRTQHRYAVLVVA